MAFDFDINYVRDNSMPYMWMCYQDYDFIRSQMRTDTKNLKIDFLHTDFLSLAKITN